MGFPTDTFYEAFPWARKVHTLLNQWTSHVPPPPLPDPGTKRKILLITAHPLPESFSMAIAGTVEDTARKEGHEVQRIDLGLERFSPSLTGDERAGYFLDRDQETRKTLPHQIRGYIRKLRWCDTLFVVYPTWWMGTPAVLKGFFDRTLRLHHTWGFPEAASPASILPAGLAPGLTNIRRVVGISTYGASRAAVLAAGDNGRSMISRPITAVFHPDCTVLWHGLYDMDFTTLPQRQAFLREVEATVRDRV